MLNFAQQVPFLVYVPFLVIAALAVIAGIFHVAVLVATRDKSSGQAATGNLVSAGTVALAWSVDPQFSKLMEHNGPRLMANGRN